MDATLYKSLIGNMRYLVATRPDNLELVCLADSLRSHALVIYKELRELLDISKVL